MSSRSYAVNALAPPASYSEAVRAHWKEYLMDAADLALSDLAIWHRLMWMFRSLLIIGTLRRQTLIPIHLVHGGQGSLPLKTRSFLGYCVPRLRAALADLLPADATVLNR